MKNFKINIEKNDAATNQLDWAIRLFLDHDEFIPAITLAGAAEEILGGLLGDRSPHKLVKKIYPFNQVFLKKLFQTSI